MLCGAYDWCLPSFFFFFFFFCCVLVFFFFFFFFFFFSSPSSTSLLLQDIVNAGSGESGYSECGVRGERI
ncbi:unnamed protein product [Staurois parvus]|uniref:Secreted protein n=1 Tax=Staurois parvus TaxID=386267 RepID=A0ABN9ALH6_9NEOB|nr:unnamed protein product [Staurois parvus]